jgi:CheY-like chemotaxis protein
MNTMHPLLLLVDDDSLDIIITKRCLKELGIHNPVVVKNNGEEALDYLVTTERSEWPCAILLDLNMPRMGGMEFLQCIKAKEALRDIPVLIVTTSTADDDINRGFALGAVEYIVKSPGLLEFKENLKCVVGYSPLLPSAVAVDEGAYGESISQEHTP